MRHVFVRVQILDEDLVIEILKHAKPVFAKLPNIVHVPINTRVTVPPPLLTFTAPAPSAYFVLSQCALNLGCG
jgi:hypothetical protein